ncbi:MAG: ESPR-type extended signal peptide-containing protein [Veillonella sp.]|nr:ESPR-type extended signal peptide-containing protein [Veillonella sp.]
MNKIFKVVWSKTKECYVVVSEVAKNNGGKKKVLASVLATLAIMGTGAQMGTPVQAGGNYGNSAVNIQPDNIPAGSQGNKVSTNSVVVGYGNDTQTGANGNGHIAYGAGNTATNESSLAVGNSNSATGKSTSAIGVGNTASAEASVALGNANTASGDRSIAIGSGAEATKAETIAAGRKAKATGDYSIALGTETEASKNNAVAIGRVSKATGTSATAIGVNNKAQADDSSAVGSSNTIAAAATQASAFGRENTVNRGGTIAAGYKNTTDGDRNVAIGNENTTSGQDSVGIGSKVTVGSGWSIAIGSNFVDETTGTVTNTIANGNAGNKADGTKKPAPAIAIGAGAQAVANSNGATGLVAIGQLAKATHNNTIAFGTQAEATANNATAVGSTAQAMGASSAAFGTQAVANGLGATAFGPGASAGTGSASGAADGSVAVGRKAAATAAGGVGIGWTASASEKNATAIGFSATASGVQSVAIGGGDEYDYPGTERGKHFTTASGKSSVAVGSYAKATEENAMALGKDANANIAGGVALGSESKTTTAAGVQGYNPASDRTNKYSTQGGAVGTSTLAAVSIGDGSDKTRQLTGLAAGTADTDAVNVAQLKNVNLKYAGDTGNSDVLLKDGTLKVKGDNNFISTSADGTGITVTAKIGNPVTANTAGKAEAPATNGLATTTNVADAINASGWNVVSSNNGGSVTGTQATKLVNPGNTVTLSAGKNIVLDQNDKQFTYSLNKDVDLTNAGSLTIGDTKVTNGGLTITGGPSITKTGIDAGSKKITNVTAGTADTDAVNVKQLKDTEKHIKPGTYAVANDGSVTLKYVDGNGTEQTETAKITGIAKKSKVINGQNTTVEEGTDTTDNSVTYKVNVKGDLADISSITNGTGSGKISFEGDQVVKVGGDHPISFDGKGGYVTGLQNKDWDITNPTVVSGRAATEDQLKKVSDGFNNTVKLTGNSGATGTQKLNQNGGLSFGVVGADNGKYITTTASGSNVVADLSTDAKAKLNSKVVVAGSGAATVGTPTVTTNPDGSTVTTYTVHVDPATATAASTESVVKKAVTGDTNIADVSVADGKATGDVGAKYEVSVSRNAVKDAAREAVTVNNGGTTTGGTYTADTNNPITVNPVKDDTNHNTTYEVKFDGAKAAKVIPLTYKANGAGDKTVTLEKGLNFTNGTNTTAEIGNDGVVKYNLNKDVDLSNTGSLTVGDTKVTNGGVTITAPAGGTTSNVTLTQSGLDNGGNKIINVAPGTLSSTSTDAVNGSQLYTVDQKFNNKINLGADGSTETTKFALDNTGGIKFNIKGDGSGASGANQYISTTANGSNVNVDLTADAKAKITVASTGTTTSSSWNLATDKVSATEGTVAAGSAATQNIADTKTVTMQAGKNLTVKQTNDGTGNASVAYSLDKDISVETVTVTGQNGKDGKIGIDGKDGVDGKDGKNRVEITVEKGAKGVDGTDGHDGVNGHNGKDGMTRIVYEDKGGKQEVATLNDGMKYAGDDAQGTDKTKVIAKKLNETLDIIGGANKTDLTTDNIGVNNDGNGKLLVQLSKNLKGINTIKNGNTTITLNDAPSTTTPAVTITGGNLSLGDGTTNNKIVNVAPGTDDTDAVNVKQLKDAKTVLADGKNTKKSGTGTAADPYKVNVEGDLTEITSITNKADASGNNAGKITFSPNQTVTVSGDHNISLNGKTGDITGLTNTTIPTTAGSDFATKGRAATEEQLKQLMLGVLQMYTNMMQLVKLLH